MVLTEASLSLKTICLKTICLDSLAKDAPSHHFKMGEHQTLERRFKVSLKF